MKQKTFITCICVSIMMLMGCVSGFFAGSEAYARTINKLKFSSSSDAYVNKTQQTEYDFWVNIAKTASTEAINKLNQGEKGNLIVLTSAGYAVVDGHTTEGCLDGLRETTGASVGKATLLSVHRSRNLPLWFFFCDKDTGDGLYCEIDSSALNLMNFTVQGELFSSQVLKNIKGENIFADPQAANDEIFKEKAFDGNEFSIVGITNMLIKNAPYDLVKCAQYHDHFCPGVMSGYYLADYMENNYPLDDTCDSYFVLSVPPWCKEDAIQQLLNTTPGKRKYAVFYLNSEDEAQIKEEAQNIAGIFFRHNKETDQWEGYVLGFDFEPAKSQSGADWSDPANVAWVEKIKLDLWCIDNLAYPLVSEIKTFTLEKGEQPSDWARPGFNPLERLELLK